MGEWMEAYIDGKDNESEGGFDSSYVSNKKRDLEALKAFLEANEEIMNVLLGIFPIYCYNEYSPLCHIFIGEDREVKLKFDRHLDGAFCIQDHGYSYHSINGKDRIQDFTVQDVSDMRKYLYESGRRIIEYQGGCLYKMDETLDMPGDEVRRETQELFYKESRMNIIYKQRQAGKTTELVRIADNYNGTIVCHSASVDHVMQRATFLGCHINRPITYTEFLRKNHNVRSTKCFHIDDVDSLLRYVTDVPIETITMSMPLSEKEPQVYVPFTVDDDIVGKVVVDKGNFRSLVLGQDDCGCSLPNCYFNYRELLKGFTIDGKPAGKLKE